ncbi:MAG: hypothetical protein ACAH27_17030 [Xanthobacteraceae bacterium]
MDLSITLTRRTRSRKLISGEVAVQERWVLNFRDPKSGQRRQLFFTRKKDAEARQRDIITKVAEGSYVDERAVPTVAEAVEHWKADKAGKVKASTFKGYATVAHTIVGPLMVGTRQERADYTEKGIKPKGARFLKMLGEVKLTELKTAAIRAWHRTVVEQCGQYTANRAKLHLQSLLALAEEDFGVRAPSMPTGLVRARHKAKKAILTSADIRTIIVAAKADLEHGLYYAFPFLAGTRPSEQLGLLWSEVDFDKNVIRIRRIQERDGSLTEMTKTSPENRRE